MNKGKFTFSCHSCFESCLVSTGGRCCASIFDEYATSEFRKALHHLSLEFLAEGAPDFTLIRKPKESLLPADDELKNFMKRQVKPRFLSSYLDEVIDSSIRDVVTHFD